MCELDLTKLRKNNKIKNYAHFDKRTSMKDPNTWNKIKDSYYVAKHAFYPFIYFEQNLKRFRHKEIVPKKRPICYSAHIDRCIYQLYAAKFNEQYNTWAIKQGVNNCAIAYRNNLKKTNIDFAKIAFDYILQQKQCYIIVGDFKSFFDNLDHQYLKQQLLDLLGVNRLSDDNYKSVTKYSYCREVDILDFFQMPHTYNARQELNKKDPIMQTDEFHDFKTGKWKGGEIKAHYVIRNPENKGIPQGSAISAVLANIYMMKFDCDIYNLVNKYHGLYMRYSDDFIVILPQISESEFVSVYRKIILQSIPNVKNLFLEKEKTQIYKFAQSKLENISKDFCAGGDYPKKKLEYLGFSFDGSIVRLRDKTISKYYYRMRRKARGSIHWKSKKNRTQTKALYRLYAGTKPHSLKERQKKEGIQKGCKKRGNF